MLYLIIALAILIGSAIVGLTGAYFIRAKRSERASKANGPIASTPPPTPVASELSDLSTQIAQAMADQRLQGETQRQLLAQKLDSVRESVESQRYHVEGLRNEIRHESRRRDHEISQIRNEIGTLQKTVGLPAAQSGERPALPPAAPEEAPTAAEEPTTEVSAFTPPPPASSPSDDVSGPAFEEVSFSMPVPALDGTPPPTQPDESPFEEATFTEETFTTASAEAPVEDEPLDMPTFDQSPGGDTFAEETFAGLASPASDGNPFEASTEPVQDQPVYEDPFATASLHDEPADEPAPDVSIDSDLDDLFEAWSPAAPSDAAPSEERADDTPEAPHAEAPHAEAPTTAAETDRPHVEALTAEAAGPFRQSETAWVARPADDDAHTPVMASPDDFLSFPPSPPSIDEEPIDGAKKATLVDLDALADIPVAPEPMASAPEPAPPAPEPASAAPGPTPIEIPEPAKVPRPIGAPTIASASEFLPFKPTTAQTPASPRPAMGEAMQPVAESSPEPARSFEAPPYAAPLPPQAAPPPIAEPAPIAAETTPAAAPEGTEDLTVIATIDEDVQRRLYEAGVQTLEEIAQWGRGDARRISTAVEVSEETIMNQWVFEAQSALFQRYSRQTTH